MTASHSATLAKATSLIAQVSQQPSDYKLTATLTPDSTRVSIHYGGEHVIRFSPAMVPEMRAHA